MLSGRSSVESSGAEGSFIRERSRNGSSSEAVGLAGDMLAGDMLPSCCVASPLSWTTPRGGLMTSEGGGGVVSGAASFSDSENVMRGGDVVGVDTRSKLS